MNPEMLDEALVLETLREVIDPELGCNVVDLGLVYSVRIDGRKVTVRMTLTTRGCPMQEQLARGVRIALLRLEPVDEAEVEIVWDPPWNPAMMSETARTQLGMFFGGPDQ